MKYYSFRRKWDIISFILAVGMFIFFLIKIESSKESECEKATQYYSTMSFNGIVIDKYIDKLNHGEPTLKIDVGDSVVLYRKYFDVSGLYEYCQVGDSVSKQSNALEVFVKRGEYRRSFIVDFDCEKL